METDGLTAIGMDSDSNAARQAPTSQGNPTPRSPIAGWPEAVTRPGLPQIRTCGTTAYGSSH